MRIVRAFVWMLLLGMIPARGFADTETWHLKCFGLDGHTMAVKAISASGRLYDVKAMRVAGGKFFDVKAIKTNGETLPVKVVPSRADRPYSDVKAITKAHTLVPVKAITTTGSSLDVKAFTTRIPANTTSNA